MSPSANEKIEASVDVTALLKLISSLGSIQAAAAPVPVFAIHPVCLEGCSLLTASQQNTLCEWLATDAKSKSPWKLAYQGSRDGFGADKFHLLCDLKGESVAVIKSSNGYLLGGYSSASWDTATKNRQWENAPGSFIFTISNPHGIPPTKYLPLVHPEYTVYHNSDRGPSFGNGHDLYVTSGYLGNSCTNFPSSYKDTTGKGKQTFTGSENFTVADIQVFTH
jgi:hypothetical protein